MPDYATRSINMYLRVISMNAMWEKKLNLTSISRIITRARGAIFAFHNNIRAKSIKRANNFQNGQNIAYREL